MCLACTWSSKKASVTGAKWSEGAGAGADVSGHQTHIGALRGTSRGHLLCQKWGLTVGVGIQVVFFSVFVGLFFSN